MGTLRFFLLFVCLVITGIYQIFGQEEIPWEPGKKLWWRDFKGEVPVGSRAAATTASGISYEFSTSYSGDELSVEYTVSTFFYPTKSWYKPEICNDVTLAHEQLHFDISELFSRKMRKRMETTTFTENIKAEVRKIYKEVLGELNDYQNRYDDETDFSRNIEQQKVWIEKIEEALKN